MRFSVTAEVTPLEGIADPEALTIERALPLLGFTGIEHLHVGKIFRFTLEAPHIDEARARAVQLCDRLLSNPVIEQSAVAIEPAGTEVQSGRSGSPEPAPNGAAG